MNCNCHSGANRIEFQPASGAATNILRSEHEAVLEVLAILEQASNRLLEENQPPSLEFFEQMVEFLSIFVDKCHHSKEEKFLFPNLELMGVMQNGGPIGCMLDEHETGRGLIGEMYEAVALIKAGNQAVGRQQLATSAIEYSQLMQNHIAKENGVLFLLADKLLRPEKQQELVTAFELIESERLGEGTHERLHGLIDQWKVQAEAWQKVSF